MINLSHWRAITRISDPIHGYIKFNIFEKEIIDSPYFQRLHFVLQNSTTYAAYPSNKNTRFPHSLGTAFLAGELLKNALSNAASDDLEAFLEDFAVFIRDHFFHASLTADLSKKQLIRLKDGWKSTIRNRSEILHQSFLRQDGDLLDSDKLYGASSINKFKGFSADFLLDTMWVSIRICGLMHDIGHLPMSHSFEGALESVPILFSLYDNDNNSERAKQYTKVSTRKISEIDESIDEKIIDRFSEYISSYFGVNKKSIALFINSIAIHERRSLAIFNIISNTVSIDDEVFLNFRNLVYTVSFLILFSTIVDKNSRKGSKSFKKFRSTSNVFRVLKGVIAGEVDADRMDYTMRDGMSCGSSIGEFDYNRIISNAILTKNASEKCYCIAFHERSLSGIERFFSERYDGYKYLIYHRTSSRTEACLQELIARLVHYAFAYPLSEITAILVEYGFLFRRDNGDITDLVPMTGETLENFDDSALRSAFFAIRRKIKRIIGTNNETMLDDFELMEQVDCLIEVVLFRKFINIYNPFLETDLRSFMKDALGPRYDKVEFLKVVADLTNKRTASVYINKLKKFILSKLSENHATIVQVQVPKIFNYKNLNEYEKIFIINNKGVLSTVESNSFYLNNMSEYEIRDVNIRIYILSKRIKLNKALQSNINIVLREGLIKLYDDLLTREAAI